MLITVNGLTLNIETAGAGRPLLLLHGFTGSSETWTPHISAFAPSFRTIAVDVIGHGRSAAPPEPTRYAMRHFVDDLVALLDQLAIDRAGVVGYSMGGRIALQLAITAPERVDALVLESTSPGIADPAARAARIAADDALADAILRDGVPAFVERWERLPLFASQARLPESVRARLRRQRLQNSPAGLANCLRGMGAGRQEPLWARLSEIACPTLLVVGELDQRYCDLARQMAAAMPAAAVRIVSGAGHAVHLEQPTAFEAAVLEFLDSHSEERSQGR